MTIPLTTTVTVGGLMIPLSCPLRVVETVEMIKITVTEGKGVYDDPYRQVEYWFTTGGELIARRDRYVEGEEP